MITAKEAIALGTASYTAGQHDMLDNLRDAINAAQEHGALPAAVAQSFREILDGAALELPPKCKTADDLVRQARSS
jgi:hypothetical protein